MARKAPIKKGVTKGQLALIGVLGSVLIGVLASNFSSAEGEVALASPSGERPAEKSGAAVGARVSSSPFGEFAEDQSWTPAPLAELVEFDPFSDGEADEPAEPQFDAAELNELRNAQDAIIFTSEGQTVARVGSKQYRVGDMVGGLEIQEISSAGIVLGQRN